jgi:hypothetical protein
MENSLWSLIITGIFSFLGGGGLWAVIKARVDKKKTPYDMFRDLLEEQKKFYEERNADYEREKLDSAEKSSVIMQSHFCKHKYKDPNIVCPVDVANDARLKKRCDRCGYSTELGAGYNKDEGNYDDGKVFSGE